MMANHISITEREDRMRKKHREKYHWPQTEAEQEEVRQADSDEEECEEDDSGGEAA